MAKAKSTKGSLADSAIDLAAHLNKKFKSAAIKLTHPHKDDSPTKVKRWISSGCKMLDIAISNLPDGGYPSGRMTVLYGPEQSGKSLAAMHAIASTQRMGGIGVLIDTEKALHEGFATAIGIDLENKFLHVPLTDLNLIFKISLETIHKVRENYGDIPLTIVIDSIAGATTEKDEQKDDFNSKGYNTEKAKMLSDGLSKLIGVVAEQDICLIVTNQVRMNMNAAGMYADPYRMPHGQSVPHYASVIIKMTKGKSINMEMVKDWKRTVGRETNARIKKNRLGPPEAMINFDIYFDRGIDDYGSWGVYADRFKLVKKEGSWYSMTYVDSDTAEVLDFKEQGWKTFCNNVLEKHPKIADKLWADIAAQYVMHYAKRSNDGILTREDDRD